MGVLSDEDLVMMRTRARHRLIGALALVVLLVVGLPLILDRHDPPAPPGPDEDGAAHAAADSRPALPDAMTPSRSAAAAPTVSAPPAEATPPAAVPAAELPSTPVQPAEAAAAPAKTAEPAPAPAGPVPAQAEAPSPPAVIPPLDIKAPQRRGEHSARPVQAPKAAPAETPLHHDAAATPRAQADPAAHPGNARGWFVQFGVFAEAARAEALAKRLEEHGIAAHNDAIRGPRGEFTRLRSGPFGTRAGADEVLARARALGENAILVHQ